MTAQTTVLDLLLDNIEAATDEDGWLEISDSLLDIIWAHILETTDDKPILMSDVIDGDAELDDLLIAFAADGSLENAANVRQRSQKLFRDFAYKMAEPYEGLVNNRFHAK